MNQLQKMYITTKILFLDMEYQIQIKIDIEIDYEKKVSLTNTSNY